MLEILGLRHSEETMKYWDFIRKSEVPFYLMFKKVLKKIIRCGIYFYEQGSSLYVSGLLLY